MTVADLRLGTRTTGRAARALEVEVVRPLDASDLALLGTERGIKPPVLVQLRSRHHSIARMVAQGKKNGEIMLATGISASRLSILKGDPSFAQLVEEYREVDASLQADFIDRATQLAISAVEELQTRVDETPEALSESTLMEMGKFAADRAGFGPVQKTSATVDIKIGLAKRLEEARLRAISAPRIVSVTDISDE